MCGGIVRAIFGGGEDSTPTVTQVKSDPTPVASSDVTTDVRKAGAGETKKKKGKGIQATSMATPLSSVDSNAGKKTLG